MEFLVNVLWIKGNQAKYQIRGLSLWQMEERGTNINYKMTYARSILHIQKIEYPLNKNAFWRMNRGYLNKTHELQASAMKLQYTGISNSWSIVDAQQL
jgi:hypothetical protein